MCVAGPGDILSRLSVAIAVTVLIAVSLVVEDEFDTSSFLSCFRLTHYMYSLLCPATQDSPTNIGSDN